MKKKTLLGVAMLLICNLSYGFIKPGYKFYTDAIIFLGLIIVFIIVIVLGVKILEKLKLWRKQ